MELGVHGFRGLGLRAPVSEVSFRFLIFRVFFGL